MRERIEQHRAGERGRSAFSPGRRAIALCSPTPYAVGMASLGFQWVQRSLNRLDDTSCERAFLPDEDLGRVAPLTYETGRSISEFPVIAFSIAYELELVGLIECLSRAGIAPLRSERGPDAPIVVAGGPLTFSNPRPLAPFVDLVVLGESEELLAPMVDALFEGRSGLARLAEQPGFYLPAFHSELPGPIGCAKIERLPAVSQLWSPEVVLPEMFLVEAERGCSRGCTFCVMRRSTSSGMRVVEPTKVLEAIDPEAPRVGLVGAAVSDHPKLAQIVGPLVEAGREVGLSSLRADRLDDELVALLVQGGMRTMTVAADGPSERLRRQLDKGIRADHLREAARLANQHRIKRLKVYAMVGVPGEQPEDLDELGALMQELVQIGAPMLQISLGVSVFVPKRNTPLADAAFVGVQPAQRALDRLRKKIGPRVQMKPPSARWAWIEAVLAGGGPDHGMAAFEAWQGGGQFAAWRKAFARRALHP